MERTATRRGAASPTNRSLERGIAILRAFRPGSELLGNGELAERTGLSRATVSRLTQTLVKTGFLQHEPALRAYRLGAPVLSLGHAMRSSSPVLRIAAPMMQALAQSRRINVGLAVPDGEDMVYLESVRYARRASLRTVVAGQRVPIALTSLGRAYLATLDDAARERLLAPMYARKPSAGRRLRREIAAAVADVRRQGWCLASWQPEVVALATPLALGGGPVHVLNVSTSGLAEPLRAAPDLAQALLELARRIERAAA
ncbi:IclR family transcriptional regulator [Bordetella sp. 2513F-2]